MTIENPTVRDAANAWLQRCELDGLERSTLRAYKTHVSLHMEKRILSPLLKNLTIVDVCEFRDHMLTNTSRAMTKKVLVSLRSLISCAQEKGWIAHNVASDVKMRRQRRLTYDRVIPTKDEIRALIKNVSKPHKPLIVTAIFTGLRSSELRGLTWQNVDFDRRVIQVRQRADRWGEMGPTKSRAGKREIPMAPMVCETLLKWREVCPKGVLGLVFPNGAGRVESHANIYSRCFKPLMAECEIVKGDGKPKFGFHSLRHAAASMFIEQEWSPKKIQTLLGHSSIITTYDVYSHLFNDAEGDLEIIANVERDLFAA